MVCHGSGGRSSGRQRRGAVGLSGPGRASAALAREAVRDPKSSGEVLWSLYFSRALLIARARVQGVIRECRGTRALLSLVGLLGVGALETQSPRRNGDLLLSRLLVFRACGGSYPAISTPALALASALAPLGSTGEAWCAISRRNRCTAPEASA